MLESQHIEDLICAIAVLDRDALVEQFNTYPSTFPIDFRASTTAGSPALPGISQNISMLLLTNSGSGSAGFSLPSEQEVVEKP
jgi:hypothetical protein